MSDISRPDPMMTGAGARTLRAMRPFDFGLAVVGAAVLLLVLVAAWILRRGWGKPLTSPSDERRVADADIAFRGTIFLGGRQEDKRNPERVRLFAEHLEEGERPFYVLPCRNSTLLLTDRRLLDLKPQLVAHGAWNVMKFEGFSLDAEIPRGAASAVRRRPVPLGPGGKVVGGELLEVFSQGKTFTFVTEPYGEGLGPDDITRFLAAFESSGRTKG